MTVWGSGLQGDQVVKVELVGSLWCTTRREDFVTPLVTLVGDLSQVKKLNIAKGTTDPRVEFISQDHSSQILNILQFQNLD